MLHVLKKLRMNNATENFVAALKNENGNKECKGNSLMFYSWIYFLGFLTFCIFMERAREGDTDSQCILTSVTTKIQQNSI